MADSLTDDQQSALSQYLAVTQQDTDQAVALLRRSEWNVQLAISKFFDGESAAPTETIPPPPPAASSSRSTLATPLPRPTGADPLTPAPRITTPPDSTTIIRRPPLLLGLFFLPFSLLYRLLSSSFSLFAYIFPFLRPSLARSATAARKGLNPRDRAARYVRDFEETVSSGESTSGDDNTGTSKAKLPWFEGGYAHALDKAKTEMKFLLVVLTSDEHDDTTTFFRKTLANPDLASFLTQNEFILWGGRVSDSEAYQVSKVLEVTQLPTTLLISFTPPNTRSTAGSTDMSVIARVHGSLTPEAFLSKLRSAHAAHVPHIEAIRQRRRANEDARRITDQSNLAYQRSLEADQRRERERQAAREAERRREEERIRKEKEVEMVELKKARWKKSVATEVWQAMKEPESGGVRIMLRMEDGKVVRTRLNKDVTLEHIYRFVECREEIEQLMKEGPETFADVEAPEDYEHAFKFRICSVMPRKVYEPSLKATVGELFAPSASLVVESGDDEESDEE